MVRAAAFAQEGHLDGPRSGLPPHDIEAEQSVIASALVAPSLIPLLASIVTAADFFREANGWIWEALVELHKREGSEGVNQVTVAHELARRGRLEDIGGVSYLSRLTTELPTSIGAEFYAKIVQRDATYRKLISAAGHIAQLAYEGAADVGEVLARAETLVANVALGVPVDILAMSEIPKPTSRAYAVDGLFQRGVISGVFGSEGVGKSYFGVDLGTALASGGEFLGRPSEQQPVVICDFEGLGEEEFTRRAYQIALGRGLQRPPPGLFFMAMPAPLLVAIPRLRAAVVQHGLGAVIVDSLSFAGVVDEPSTITARRELAGLGITVIVLDHQARLQRLDAYDIKGPYGSRFKEAMMSSLWQLELADGQPPGAIEILMRDKKNRTGASRPGIGLHIAFTGDAVTLTAIDPAGSAGLATKLPAAVQVEVALTRLQPTTADDIAEATGLLKSTVKTWLSRMKRAGRAYNQPGATPKSPHAWVCPSATLLSTQVERVDVGVDPIRVVNASTHNLPSTPSTQEATAPSTQDESCDC